MNQNHQSLILRTRRCVGIGLVILFVSCVLIAPRATLGHDSRRVEPTRPVAAVQMPVARQLVPGSLMARTMPRPASFSRAQSPDRPEDLSIDASLGDIQFAFERKKHRRPQPTLVVIQVIAVLVSSRIGVSEDPGLPMIDLQATITGTDAVPGSLLYALAWLANDTDPLGSVRALGYDIEVRKEHDHPCAGDQPKEICVDHALKLATLLDAALALGSPDDRLQFRQGASALGIAPDCGSSATFSSAAARSDDDLSIDASLGDQQLVLEKAGKRQRELMVIKRVDMSSSRTGVCDHCGPVMIDLHAKITGPDAVPGSLLYTVAWLAGDTDPLRSVRALGYDIEVRIEHGRPCTSELAGSCGDEARRLATLLDATLALGSPDVRLQFRQDAVALGVPPDCALRAPVTTPSVR